jgi:hypothetical protein
MCTSGMALCKKEKGKKLSASLFNMQKLASPCM